MKYNIIHKFYLYVMGYRHEITVMLLLLAVCSVPFWPLILAAIGFHSNVIMLLFHLQLSPDLFSTTSSSWLLELALNLFGYVLVLMPIYLISIYLHRIKYDEHCGSGWMARTIKSCLFETRPGLPVVVTSGPCPKQSRSTRSLWQRLCQPSTGSIEYYVLLLASAAGLQVAYLTWGVLQERIMTRKYGPEVFLNSQFLVFYNRLLAVGIASVTLLLSSSSFFRNKSFPSISSSDPVPAPTSSAPYFKFSYASLSNILSSWCQYEALKFVSFPVQVLAKASKIIPVMLMGKLVRRQTYRWDEYISAGIISAGVALFLLDTTSGAHSKANNADSAGGLYHTVSGMILLVGYMMFDSFTSNWQDRLFKTYKVNSFQMMAGVNIWSCLLTASSLLEHGGLQSSLAFCVRHPTFLRDATLLSLCGAVGQLFIFFTISRFGALTFTVIMTTRQALAILLSCAVYGHPMRPIGVAGLLLVFLALFSRSYRSFYASKSSKK